MSKTLREIKLLHNKLSELDILSNLYRIIPFYDDPKFFQFGVSIKNLEKYTDKVYEKMPTANGYSFFSSENALVKCLGEAAERFCLFSFNNTGIKYSSYANLKENALDPFIYTGNKEDRNKEIGWMEGHLLADDSSCLIPADLVFVNYVRKINELKLPQHNTTSGGAGGFDKKKVIINCIYEVIERDAFMNTYLNCISLPRINLKSINNEIALKILDSCERYKLELYVFDATNDLSIPTYISVLVDRTGLGPAVTVGAKSGLKAEEAIFGSAAETFMQRPWLRRLKKNKIKRTLSEKKAIYWYNTKKINSLMFLLSSSQKNKKIKSVEYSIEKELLKVKEMVESKGYKIYYVDITHKELKKIGYQVLKVIIPGLQPLYLSEKYKKHINLKRLDQVSKFFGQDKSSVNPIPHPFT